MAFEPKKADFNQINGGQEYNEESFVRPSDFNDVYKSVHYSQKAIELLTENIDTTDVGNIGNPSVSLVPITIDGVGYYKLKFANLKGDSGVGNATLSNQFGESSENGYTQQGVNSLLSRPNLLINPDFKINQRGKTVYNSNAEGGGYTVDRWKKSTYASVTLTDKGIQLKSINSTNSVYLGQAIENGFELYKGKYATMTIKYANGTISSKTGYIPEKLPTSTQSIVGLFNDFAGQTGTSLYLKATGELFAQIGTNAANTLEVEWIKVEIGRSATEFIPRLVPEEISLCKRYYQRIDANELTTLGMAFASKKSIDLNLSLPVGLRILPTVNADVSNIIAYDHTSNEYLFNVTGVTVSGTISNLLLNVNGAWTQGNLCDVNLSAGGYIELDAELYGHT